MNLHRFSFKNEAILTMLFVFVPVAAFFLVLMIVALARWLR